MSEILIMGNMPDKDLGILKAEFIVHRAIEISNFEKFLVEQGDKISAVATTGFVGVHNNIIEKLENLEIISSNGVGYDSIDATFCADRGIIVTHTPDVLNAEVANTTIMLFLNSFREFSFNEAYLKSGRWKLEGMAPYSRSPDNRIVGMLGMGRIGQEIASRLSMFNPKILYHSRSPKDVPYTYYKDLKTMARDCEVLICITPGGIKTNKLVNEEILTALGPTGTLINIARGSVVDQTALIKTLEDGRLGYAALDVFESEPNVPDELIHMSNVTLLPHVGSATFETRAAMGELTLNNLIEFKRNGKVLTPVPECLNLEKSIT
jgi:lactate dehydrogenase-like 2-hydroxyacid dehydrogenase